MMSYLIVFITLVFLTKYSISAEPRTFRLPTTAYPTHYSLKFLTSLEEDTFKGETTVYVVCLTSLNNLTLHANDLNITEAFIDEVPARWETLENDFLKLGIEGEMLQPGEHRVHLKYTGRVNTDYGVVRGRNEYGDVNILATEFEPHNARKAFPCFDEPSFKAKFNVRIVVADENYTALSNMPEINRFESPAGTVYDFATSVKMSTYLLSFAVMNFPYYEDMFEHNGKKTTLRVYTNEASEAKNGVALENVKTALKYFSEYTEINYPLPKLDWLEYNKSRSLATEIWGLIQIREGMLTSSSFESNDAQFIVFHELAHFWFGNLVTNDWWNDLWLQEGFASFMSYKLISKLQNTSLLQHLSTPADQTYQSELVMSTNAVAQHFRSPEDFDSLFSEIVYYKAAEIILMVENYVGEETFREVLKIFLKRYAFRTATANDFMSVVEEVFPDTHVRSFLESYLYQSKYPVVNVNLENDTYILTQEICINNNHSQENSFKHKWTIPISYITDANTSKTIWFDRDLDQVSVTEPNSSWVIFNNISYGFYIVNYSVQIWDKFMEKIEKMGFYEQKTLVEQAVQGFIHSRLPCEVVFRLIDKINNLKLLSSVFKFFVGLGGDLNCTDTSYNILNKYVKQKYADLGLNGRINALEYCEPTENFASSSKFTENCSEWIKKELPKWLKNTHD